MSDALSGGMGLGFVVGDDSAVDAYKRAVYRRAPSCFSFETIEPAKHGGNYHYGLRIHPIMSETATINSSSTVQTSVYVIWRRWEDCLWLQHTLEEEYENVVKGKKSERLRSAALGVTRPAPADDGTSLPPMDPWLLAPRDERHASDVHVYLPRLTKTGTIFRPSPRTVARRGDEFRAFMRALLGDDVPPALRALRSDRLVHDFFGFWRRDADIAQKAESAAGPPSLRLSTRSRASTFASSAHTPSLTSGSSDAGQSDSPPPVWSVPSGASHSPTGTRGLMSSIAAWRPSAETSPDKTRRLQELSDLVVQVDTVEEAFEDRRNTLKQETVHDELRQAFRQDGEDGEDDERRNTLRPGDIEPVVCPSTPSPTPSVLSAPSSTCLSPAYDAHRPDSRLSSSSRPSVESSHTSQSSWSFRTRPLPKPPSSTGSHAHEILGVQPVPAAGTPDARIVLYPNSELPPAPVPTPAPTGLPLPPRAHRSRVDSRPSRAGASRTCESDTEGAGSSSHQHAPWRPLSPAAISRTSSTATFGLDADGAFSARPLQPRRDSLMSAGASVASEGASSAFAADIHNGVVRLSAVAPRVVWIQPQTAPRTESFSHHRPQRPLEPRRSTEPEYRDSVDLKSRASAGSPPLEDLLELDVSQRWWRHSATTTTSADTVTASPLTAYPPDELFESEASGSEDGTETGEDESSSSAALSLGSSPGPSPAPSPVPSQRSFGPRARRSPPLALPYTEPSSVSAVLSHASPYPAGTPVSTVLSHATPESEYKTYPSPISAPAPALASASTGYTTYARAMDRAQRPSSAHRIQDWVVHVPAGPTVQHTTSLLGALAPQPRRKRESWASASSYTRSDTVRP